MILSMKTKGTWPFILEWYSICSAHQEHDENCDMCTHGVWHNKYGMKFSKFVFKKYPKLWIWWMNRKPVKFGPVAQSVEAADSNPVQ